MTVYLMKQDFTNNRTNAGGAYRYADTGRELSVWHKPTRQRRH